MVSVAVPPSCRRGRWRYCAPVKARTHKEDTLAHIEPLQPQPKEWSERTIQTHTVTKQTEQKGVHGTHEDQKPMFRSPPGACRWPNSRAAAAASASMQATSSPMSCSMISTFREAIGSAWGSSTVGATNGWATKTTSKKNVSKQKRTYLAPRRENTSQRRRQGHRQQRHRRQRGRRYALCCFFLIGFGILRRWRFRLSR